MLAHLGDEPVGWAGVARRRELPVARSRVVPTVEFARENGAPAVEAVPVDNGAEKVDLTMGFVGFRALFESADFVKVADTSSVASGFPRIVMRRSLA